MVPSSARAGAATAPDNGPSEAFWDKYNKRLEFPLSTVSALLLHALIGAVIVFGIFRLMNSEADRKTIAMQPADIVGFDDGGLGAPNPGGEQEADTRRPERVAPADRPGALDPRPLPEIQGRHPKADRAPRSHRQTADLGFQRRASMRHFTRASWTSSLALPKGSGAGGSAQAARQRIQPSAGTCAGCLRFKVSGRARLHRPVALDGRE